MKVSRRAWWLLIISALYFFVGYWYLFVQRNDGMLVLAQAGYCLMCALPLYSRRLARFLHMRPLLRR